MRGCEIGRDRALPIALPIAEWVPIAVKGVKQRQYSIQLVEEATKDFVHAWNYLNVSE